MGTEVVHAALTTPYIATLIRVKALQLVRRPGFRRSERQDLEQELRAHVLTMAHHYDPSRGAVNTFIDRVVDSAAAMIVRSRSRLKRVAAYRAESLDRPVGEGRQQALSDLMASGCVHRRFGTLDRGELERAEQVVDVTSVLATLPPELQDIARRLAASNEAAVARELGISRRQVRNAVAEIRRRFEEAGLGNF